MQCYIPREKCIFLKMVSIFLLRHTYTDRNTKNLKYPVCVTRWKWTGRKNNLIQFSDEIVLKNITYFLPNDPSYIYPDIVKAIPLKEDIMIGEGSG